MASKEIMRSWWELRDLIADCERDCKRAGDTEWLPMFEEHFDHMIEIAKNPTRDAIKTKARSIATALDCNPDRPWFLLLLDLRWALKERLGQ